MSGGVDSSVAAALLKEQGYQVIGITLKIPGWSPIRANLATGGGMAKPGKNTCCDISYPSLFHNYGRRRPKPDYGVGRVATDSGIEDARQVAFKLNIPFYVLNYKTRFEQEIISEFCHEYLNGRTPNPCVMCNTKIKFGSLLKKARSLGADYVATGHYAGVRYNKNIKRYQLSQGKDAKEQSYFLYALSQRQLRHTLFPLADYTKEQVREIARRLKLPVFDKPASQDICFIPDRDYGRFIKQRYPQAERPGPVIHTSGKVLGQHKGIAFYTIGQRGGLGIAYGTPIYIVAFDKRKNAIIVGGKKDVLKRELMAHKVNWLSIPPPKKPIRAKVKIRHGSQESSAVVTPLPNNRAKIIFSKPQEAITPGQSVVFYQRYKVLGGGIIKSVRLN